MRDFLSFYKAILIETCADYKPFHAVSNTIETMKKFLLITEILTHEYKDNGNRLMSFKLSVWTLGKTGSIFLGKTGSIFLIIKTLLFQYS